MGVRKGKTRHVCGGGREFEEERTSETEREMCWRWREGRWMGVGWVWECEGTSGGGVMGDAVGWVVGRVDGMRGSEEGEGGKETWLAKRERGRLGFGLEFRMDAMLYRL